MNIREISKPITAKSLNESLARKFGQRIKLESFTLEQLYDVRNKLRTSLSQVETNESYDSVQKNENYQKNRLFLDVLNAEIDERESIDEGKMPMGPGPDGKKGTKDDKPAFLDQKTGDKKSKGKKPKKGEVPPQFKKKTDEGKQIIENYFTYAMRLVEGAEDQAELVMAAKDMVDRVTSWMEDTAEMQTESMLELADAIRDEMGNEQSEAFVSSVKPALESLYTAMEGTRAALTSGVGLLTGEEAPAAEMGAEDDMAEPEMEPTVDAEEPAPEEDEFAAAEPAAGGEEEAGREKRESVQRSKKKV